MVKLLIKNSLQILALGLSPLPSFYVGCTVRDFAIKQQKPKKSEASGGSSSKFKIFSREKSCKNSCKSADFNTKTQN